MTILPGGTLGVLGGGQLGRMFILAAHAMGYRTAVFDPAGECPAGQVAGLHVRAAWDDRAALRRFAEACDAVTIEFENIPVESIAYVASLVRTAPNPDAVRVAQDRLLEKTLFRSLDLPTPRFAPVLAEADVDDAVAATGLPAILKTARFGYDGKGQARVASADDVREAFRSFGGAPCILEQRLTLDFEVSVITVRGDDGTVVAFPPGENVHERGILHTTTVPSTRASSALLAQAAEMAARIATALDYVGVLGTEFFVAEGSLYVNEIAPRPHNSGHWTQDGAATSQFEQQARALAGLPLGAVTLLSPTAMANILGDVWPSEGAPAWAAALARPGVHLHLYGKAEARPGRKMGHLNCTGATPADALAIAESAWVALHRHRPA